MLRYRALYPQFNQWFADKPAGILLHIAAQRSWLITTDHQFCLPIGELSAIAGQPLSYPPTPYQMELAIYQIEEQLSTLRHQLSTHLPLYCLHRALLKWPALLTVTDNTLSQAQIEQLFTYQSHVVAGTPAHYYGLPSTGQFVMQLLIVRELMHHFAIEQCSFLSLDSVRS